MNKGDVLIPVCLQGGSQEVVALPLGTHWFRRWWLCHQRAPGAFLSLPFHLHQGSCITVDHRASHSAPLLQNGGVSYLKFKATQHFLEDRVSISSQLVLSTSKESFEPGQGLAGTSTVLAETPCSSSQRLLLVQPQHICMQTDVSWLALSLSYAGGLISFFFFFLHSFPSRNQSVSFSL